jgi:hypothetical protein
MKTDTAAGTDTETKLDIGRQNPVQTSFEFHAADAVPFDTTALYSYLFKQAEHHYACSYPENVVAIFEAEFASAGAVPDLVRMTIADRLAENGVADAPPGDDLKRDALVALFVDEYSRAFAANSNDLPDPRGVPIDTSRSAHRSVVSCLRQRLSSLLGLRK